MIKFIERVFRLIRLSVLGRERYAKEIGVRIGKECRLIGKVNFGSEPYLVNIGDHVSITSSSFITHDGGVWVFRDQFPLLDVFSPIFIGNNVFIGVGCTILPGTRIGDNTVVGAGSVVVGRLDGNSVYAGVPAKKIKSLSDYRDKCLKLGLMVKGSNAKKNILLKKYSSC